MLSQTYLFSQSQQNLIIYLKRPLIIEGSYFYKPQLFKMVLLQEKYLPK